MLIWYYGSTMKLGAIVTTPEGDRQGGATVTYEIFDRAGDSVLAGTLAEVVDDEGAYEDSIAIEDVLPSDPEGVLAATRDRLYRARIVAALPTGVTRQSSPRIQLLHDVD